MSASQALKVGDLIRRWRLAAGLTQEELAERASMSAAAIAALERGRRRAPRKQTLVLIASALRIGPAEQAALELAARPATPNPSLTSTAPLPQPPTRLIGREHEIGAARALLRRRQPPVRLLTLTGAGGVGKTRLALAIAAAAQPDYADGVALVELAPIHDDRLVPVTVARALGVRESDGASARDLLLQHLRDRHLLLVLDNFEHLLGAAVWLVDLLANTPRLQVLVTSRTALRVRAEHRLPVPPLATRALKGPSSVEQIGSLAAVELFVERAQAVAPGFRLEDTNAADVAQLCRRLDGLPLAIEITAPRAALMPPADLLLRLEQLLPFLSRGPRDLPRRQQTLRATLDWSYDLLTEESRSTLARLAVFDGGGTLTAAEEVAGATLDGLSELADNSLIVLSVLDDGARFSLLETVRAYARERLEANGELAATQHAHTRWFLELAAHADRALIAPEFADQERWILRLERDHDNLRAALRQGLAAGNVEEVAEGLWHLHGFLWSRGEATDLRTVADELRTRQVQLSPQAQARAIYAAGVAAHMQNDLRRAWELFGQALEQSRLLDDQRLIGLCLMLLAYAQPIRADDAITRLKESAVHLRAAGDAWGEAITVAGIGDMALRDGDFALAEECLSEYVKRTRTRGDLRGLGQALQTLGTLVLLRKAYQPAVTLLLESISICRRVKHRERVAWSLRGLASVAAARQEWELTARLLGAAAGFDSRETPLVAAEELFTQAGDEALAHLGLASFAEAQTIGRLQVLEELLDELLGVFADVKRPGS